MIKTHFIFNLKDNISESIEFDNEFEALQFARKLAFQENLKKVYYHPFKNVWVVNSIKDIND